jgi:hypothetical protein
MSDIPPSIIKVKDLLKDRIIAAFGLPEILSLITSFFHYDKFEYVDKDDRTAIPSCHRVSKAFYLAFAPRLWEVLIVGENTYPPLDSVASNTRFVDLFII